MSLVLSIPKLFSPTPAQLATPESVHIPAANITTSHHSGSKRVGPNVSKSVISVSENGSYAVCKTANGRRNQRG